MVCLGTSFWSAEDTLMTCSLFPGFGALIVYAYFRSRSTEFLLILALAHVLWFWVDLVINLDDISLGVKSSPIHVPPPWDVSQQKLRNSFWAKISRYRQLELPAGVWQQDLVFQLATLASQGFCRRRLRNLIFSMYKMAAQDEIDFLKTAVCTPLFKGVCASAAARAQ